MPKLRAMRPGALAKDRAMQSSEKHNTPRKGKGQAEDFLKAIFNQQAGSLLEIRAFPGPRQYFFSIPSELDKAAALAISLKNQTDYFADPRNQQSQQQRFSTEVFSLLNTSTSSLLVIKGAP